VTGYLLEILSFAIPTLTTLFVVVDPFGCVPLFVAMTAGDPPEAKRRTALRSSLVAMGTLTGFAVAGGLIFQVLGISVGAFRIAGGILLFLLAVDMLRAQRSRQKTTPEEEAEGTTKEDVSVFPLAIPMLAGPGATSTVVMLMSRAQFFWEYALVFGAILLVSLLTYLVFRGAAAVSRRLGQTGTNVLERIMGLVVAAAAVQFVVEGVALLIPTVMRSGV
jgi:multiple antibiotic resistance protein